MRIDELDDKVYTVCRNWYSSSGTPLMYAVAYRVGNKTDNDADIEGLLRELEGCRAEALPNNAQEVAHIDEAITILRKVQEREAMHLEIRDLAIKARQMGLERRDVVAMIEASWENR